jgi:hypothetical protein
MMIGKIREKSLCIPAQQTNEASEKRFKNIFGGTRKRTDLFAEKNDRIGDRYEFSCSQIV